MNSKLTETQIKEIIDKYIDGQSNKSLSQEYQVNRGTIQAVLKKNNITLRTQEVTARKHTLRKNLFVDLNEFEAHMLGMLWADGNLSGSRIDLRLHEQDKHLLDSYSEYIYGFVHLQNIKERIHLTGLVKYSSPQYRFGFGGKEIADTLRNLGLHENKTFSIKPPNIPQHLYRYFILGYIDGDGSISDNHNSPSIRVTSNIYIIEFIAEYFKNTFGINSTITEVKPSVYILTVSGRLQILKILDHLYEDAPIYLDRKHEKYMNLKFREVKPKSGGGRFHQKYKANNALDDALGNAEALVHMKENMGLKINLE